MERRRVAQALVGVAALTVFFVLAPKWPKDQSLRFMLGDAAPRVQELTVRYAPGASEEWTREASFRYAPKSPAPRVVTHDPRLADGDWTLEIELASANDRTTVRRRVTLEGKAVTIELAQAVPK